MKYDNSQLEYLLKKGLISQKAFEKLAVKSADGMLVQLPEQDPNAIVVDVNKPTAPANDGRMALVSASQNAQPFQKEKPIDVSQIKKADLPIQGEESAPLASDIEAQKQLEKQTQNQAISEGAQRIAEPYSQMQQAVMGGALAGEAAAAETAAYQNKMAKEQEKRLLDQQENEDKRQKALNDQQAAYDQAVEEYKAKASIDPNRLFKNQTNGQKVLAGIGLLLGSFGGRGNSAVEVIDNAIKRDVLAQQQDVETLAGNVKAQQGIYKDMLDRFQNDRLAQSATMAAYYDLAKNRIQAIASRANSKQALTNAQIALQELELKKQQHVADFVQNSQRAMQMAQLQGGNTGGVDVSKLTEDERKRFVPGYGLALDEDSSRKAREVVSNANSNLNTLKKLQNLIGKNPADFNNRAVAESLQQVLVGALREDILGPGTINDGERAMIQNLIANPTKLFTLDSTNAAKLKTLQERIENRRDEKLNVYGLPVKTKGLDLQARVR